MDRWTHGCMGGWMNGEPLFLRRVDKGKETSEMS